MSDMKLCTVEGCGKALRARGYCTTHWARWRRHGTTDLPPKPVRREICTVPKCQKKAERGFGAESICLPHYMRKYKKGTFGDVAVDEKKIIDPILGKYVTVKLGEIRICQVDGCSTRADGLRWCKKHATRYRRHGDPEKFIPVDQRDMATGPRNIHWTGDSATYSAVHQRIRKVRGRASRYQCVDCGEQAKQWSYNRSDANEKLGVAETPNPVPYSVSLESYVPRCISCHKKFDLRAIREQAS